VQPASPATAMTAAIFTTIGVFMVDILFEQ
jgi:hypothetical protein